MPESAAHRFAPLFVQEPLVDIRNFAVVKTRGFLLILLRHLLQDAGNVRAPGYTRLPHANAREFNQISKRTHLPSRRFLGSQRVFASI
jgi:hypothetical protein